MPIVNGTERIEPRSPRRRRASPALLALLGLLSGMGVAVGLAFSTAGLQIGPSLLFAQVGTTTQMGTGIPHGFYTEFYTSHDLELPGRSFVGPYSSRLCTFRRGTLVGGVSWFDLSESRPAPRR